LVWQEEIFLGLRYEERKEAEVDCSREDAINQPDLSDIFLILNHQFVSGN